MNKLKCRNTVFALLVVAATGYGPAYGFELKAGKWSVTTTVQTPMSATPVVNTTEDCIETGFDPLAELMKEQIEGCDVLSTDDSDDRLEMTMQCAIPGAGTIDGQVLFVTSGDAATGQMDMAMDIGGMTMNMETAWQGKYLGVCTP